jgi:hypothetical protein
MLDAHSGAGASRRPGHHQRRDEMTKFLALYVGTAEAMEKYQQSFPDPAQRKAREQAGMAGWTQWVRTNEKAIVDMGAPLGKTKRVDAGGMTDIRNAVAGYTIVQAPSHEAAAKLFENHPHFTLFPGDAVEVMPCLAIPGM